MYPGVPRRVEKRLSSPAFPHYAAKPKSPILRSKLLSMNMFSAFISLWKTPTS